MAFVLNQENDMKVIYETAKKVYAHEMTAAEAVDQLLNKTDASEASLKMYYTIYACMRKGKTYKMGTSEQFTQYLLERILQDAGVKAFELALTAVKGNDEYRASKNNAQPGLRRACMNAIRNSGLSINYDLLSVNGCFDSAESAMCEDDLEKLKKSIDLPNTEYARNIMELLEKYQVLTVDEISQLTDQVFCSTNFRSSFPILKEIEPSLSVEEQIKDAAGRNRYYGITYVLHGKNYVFTSQLYGLGNSPTTRDNRTPFLEWILNKFSIDEPFEHLPECSIPKQIGTFDSWEIIDANTAIKHCDKSFFAYRGSGVPKSICWFFNAEDMDLSETKSIKLICDGRQYSANIKNESSDRRRVRIFWSVELGHVFDAYNMPGTTATFKRISDDTYEVLITGGEEEVPVKETLESIKKYITEKGFSYEAGLLENFYLSLKSKPFVILAGTSGTGKTRLVKLFAEAIGATTNNGRYKMVSVRPDWSDSSDLFGHVDLNGHFCPGAIIDFVKAAAKHTDKPYFLCLDEMNLARVEYYLSDFLSVIETRDKEATGKITSDPLVPANYFGSDDEAKETYGTLLLPENLYVIGTVNMDETTFPFSRKVLDRANTIEFSYVDLMPHLGEAVEEIPAAGNVSNAFLKTEYLLLAQCTEDAEPVNEYCSELQQINKILQKASAHVGYRVRDEIVFYLLNNKKNELLPENEAMDNELMQKILPRIQGSSASIKNMLCDLFKHCAGDYEGYQTQSDDVSAKMMKALASPTCKYKRSAEKIAFMVRRFEEDGFTSYWL